MAVESCGDLEAYVGLHLEGAACAPLFALGEPSARHEEVCTLSPRPAESDVGALVNGDSCGSSIDEREFW